MGSSTIHQSWQNIKRQEYGVREKGRGKGGLGKNAFEIEERLWTKFHKKRKERKWCCRMD